VLASLILPTLPTRTFVKFYLANSHCIYTQLVGYYPVPYAHRTRVKSLSYISQNLNFRHSTVASTMSAWYELERYDLIRVRLQYCTAHVEVGGVRVCDAHAVLGDTFVSTLVGFETLTNLQRSCSNATHAAPQVSSI